MKQINIVINFLIFFFNENIEKNDSKYLELCNINKRTDNIIGFSLLISHLEKSNIISNFIDQIIVIFPFEVKYFQSKNIFVNFVGHPFFDEWIPSSKNKLKYKLKLNINNPVLTLFPGSRKDEIKIYSIKLIIIKFNWLDQCYRY